MCLEQRVIGDRKWGTEDTDIRSGDEKRFGIENGAMLLKPCFGDIIYHDYQDLMLFFSDFQLILAYVISEQVVAEHMTLDNLADFVARIKRRLAKNRQITVTVRKGLFTARKR